jgi:hypothetical protein
MKNIGLLISAFFLIINISTIGQNKTRVVATGSFISSDLTPEQTKAKAIEDAKRNALLKAGVGETVSFTDFSYKYEDSQRFDEIFQAISTIQTGGEIIVDTILNETRSFNEFGNMMVEVEIEATIYQHNEKADPTFLIAVEGIDEVYKNEDLLQFTITPTRDGYLKIFNVNENETSLLYPYRDSENPQYSDKTNHLFEAEKIVQLPLHPAFDHGYFLEVGSPGKAEEFNILIFVFTKQNIPFIQKPDFNSMMQWIYAIPPNERVMLQEGFVIKNGG